MKHLGEIMLIFFLGIIIIFWVIRIIITNKNVKIVLEKSQRIQTLLGLNDTIHFKVLQSRYDNHTICNSKRQLDHLFLDDYLMTLIDSEESYYRNIIDSISYNRYQYETYKSEIAKIKTSASEDYCRSFGFKLSKFLKYEEKVFKRNLICKPQLEVIVNCKATYTSPQGRNHYWKEESYTYIELKRLFDQTIELKKLRETRQYQIKLERSKMTASLRYDILERDNHRCQICGSTVQDGVKLHVDHIVPVSKGGKTIPSNLRTLCDRCNLGKSDKI